MRLVIASRLHLQGKAQQFLFPFLYVSGRSEIVSGLSELVSLSVCDSIRGFLVKVIAKVSQRNETTKLLTTIFVGYDTNSPLFLFYLHNSESIDEVITRIFSIITIIISICFCF